ncbi:MAG: DUF4845 domain-containing protein [Rhodocyclaceae bacterium]|nr:DUF4845 domain-containing protein [Rhodocyclaceae bacterium]
MSMHKQSGVSLIGTLIIGAILAFFFLLALKAVPAYTEFMAVERVFKQIADNSSVDTTVAQIRRDYEKRAYIDDIKSVEPADVQVSKHTGKVVLSADYEKRIPVVANISLVIAFSASSSKVPGATGRATP